MKWDFEGVGGLTTCVAFRQTQSWHGTTTPEFWMKKPKIYFRVAFRTNNHGISRRLDSGRKLQLFLSCSVAFRYKQPWNYHA